MITPPNTVTTSVVTVDTPVPSEPDSLEEAGTLAEDNRVSLKRTASVHDLNGANNKKANLRGSYPSNRVFNLAVGQILRYQASPAGSSSSGSVNNRVGDEDNNLGTYLG